MPMAAKFLTNGDMTNLKMYRFAYPPMLILGILLSIMVYANTQEKIIQAKTHVVQVKFIDAVRAVAKNKYFWIISLAGWIGFLESSYNKILQWLYQYQHACTEGLLSWKFMVWMIVLLFILFPVAIKEVQWESVGNMVFYTLGHAFIGQQSGSDPRSSTVPETD